MPVRSRILIALLLGGALTTGLLHLVRPPVVEGAPPAWSAEERAPSGPSEAAFHIYDRIQTVTLRPPDLSAIYATVFTTTFETTIEGYKLGWGWLRMPTDAITIAATCGTNPLCGVEWGEVDGYPVIYFTGSGTDTVYLAYDTASRASRGADSPLVQLSYPVGFFQLTQTIGLTNTIFFSRGIQLHPEWQLASASPEGYDYDEANRKLRWTYTDTSRIEFSVTITEPLLGSDLVIDHFEVGNLRPEVDELVRYTITVRNQGAYRTRGVLAELFVRPLSLGAPTVLTDHVGGWLDYAMDALFKWEGSDHWWPVLEPGEVITGSTVLTWPDKCAAEPCSAWAKVDPTYLGLGESYDWFGYNPEGLDCGLDESHLPTCPEEQNNLGILDNRLAGIFLPLVMRSGFHGEE
ncbi:MAG TPA: hypothetical protein ENN99_14950 [Chloroflexi bacterium]|nr:hypothetical protein [Chloroflexota bacterium]